MKTHTIQPRGFTLIEMLVSVAIFSVVMVMALGALISLSTADRKAEALKSAIDNLNFGIDSMSRAIRTGNNYNCNTKSGGDCWPTGSNTFYFTSNTGVVTGYRLDSSQDPAVSQCGQTMLPYGCLERSLDGGNTWLAVTSPNVVLTDLSAQGGYLFYLKGSTTGSPDNTQPIVVITLSGFAQVSPTQQSQFHLQTTITQRIYDQ